MHGILNACVALFLNRSAPPREAEPEPGSTHTAPRCVGIVLIIDDDPDLLRTLQPTYADAGYRVLTAGSGVKGLDLLRYTASDVRLILLDYRMPRLDGLQCLTHLRKLAPKAKVVGLTGLGADAVPADFRSAVDLFLSKPILPGLLLQRSSALLVP